MIKPYISRIVKGQKHFSVNPEYAKIFESLGINSENEAFFRTNPFDSGLHSDTTENEPHFQYFENSVDSHFTGFFIVKKENLPLLYGQKLNSPQVEEFFEGLEVSVEYILDDVISSNEWAKTNYPEVYLPGLGRLITQYKITFENK